MNNGDATKKPSGRAPCWDAVIELMYRAELPLSALGFRRPRKGASSRYGTDNDAYERTTWLGLKEDLGMVVSRSEDADIYVDVDVDVGVNMNSGNASTGYETTEIGPEGNELVSRLGLVAEAASDRGSSSSTSAAASSSGTSVAVNKGKVAHEILLSDSVLRWVRAMQGSPYVEMFEQRMRRLAEGDRSYCLSKPLKHAKLVGSYVLYETKLDKGQRILWTEFIGSSQGSNTILVSHSIYMLLVKLDQ